MRALSFAVLLITAVTRASNACSCLEPSPAGALSWSSAVFSGHVLSVKHEGKHDCERRHRILVERAWKGTQAGKVVTVYTDGCFTCGIAFQKDSHVMIYARLIERGAHKGALSTGLCTRSGRSVAAESDSLGPPLSVLKP
jgi:hypothetical protein